MFESRTLRRKKKLLKKKYKKATEVSGSQLAIAFRRFRKNKAGILGLFLSVGIFSIAIFADILSPYPPLEPMALYDYVPWYVEPGLTEGALATGEHGSLLFQYSPDFPFQDGDFWQDNPNRSPWEFEKGEDGEVGWELVDPVILLLMEGIPLAPGALLLAVRSTGGSGMLSQNLTSTLDLLYTKISFQAYLIGDDPTNLFVYFTFEDGSQEKIKFYINNSETWETKTEQFYCYPVNMTIKTKIRNPVKISFSKDEVGSEIVLDNIKIQAGEYFEHLHLFGTNWRSHDLFSKLLFGSRVSLIVSVGAIIISLFIGLPLGLVAGYFRGRIDEIIMRITDIFLTLPFYFVMILVISVLQDTPDLDNLIIELGITAEVIVVSVTLGLGIFGWMGITRLIRATIFQIREMDYVEAARALGASNTRIMVIHILPNILAPLIVVVTYALAVNIVAEAGLAFLGFTDASLASWGRELDDGVEIVSVAWWPVLFPALFIIVAVLAFNLLGDGLRDAFDPRLR